MDGSKPYMKRFLFSWHADAIGYNEENAWKGRMIVLTWRVAETEAERESGIGFVCRHAADLGLLYNWCTIMNVMVYAMEDNGFVIGTDEDGRIAAVLAHTIGTLEDGYKDPGRIEVHLLYIEEQWRSGAALLSALRMLAAKLLELPQEVREVVFFTPSTERNRRMFGRLATLARTTEPPCGVLDFYAAPAERLLRHDRAGTGRAGNQPAAHAR